MSFFHCNRETKTGDKRLPHWLNSLMADLDLSMRLLTTEGTSQTCTRTQGGGLCKWGCSETRHPWNYENLMVRVRGGAVKHDLRYCLKLMSLPYLSPHISP